MKDHMEYTFISETRDIYSERIVGRITYETNADGRDDILADFGSFLKACGYRIDGEVTVVPFEKNENE